MDRQGRALDELFSTARPIAGMRSDASVNTFYIVSERHCLNETGLPCRARSLRRAKPFPHVEQAKFLAAWSFDAWTPSGIWVFW